MFVVPSGWGEFEWWRPKAGFALLPKYETARGAARVTVAGRDLVPSPRPGGADRLGPHVEWYRPFDDPALYRRFARISLPLTDEDWLEFANRYGALTVSWRREQVSVGPLQPADLPEAGMAARLFSSDPSKSEAAERRVGAGVASREGREEILPSDVVQGASEYLDQLRSRFPTGASSVADDDRLWTEQIEQMRLALGMWDLLRSGATGTAAQLVPEAIDVETGEIDEEAIRGLLSWNVSWHLIEYCSAVISVEDGDFKIGVEPSDLLGALWLQFARALEIDAHYRPCSVCGEDFEILPTDGRTQRRKYCSRACSQRSTRERKQR